MKRIFFILFLSLLTLSAFSQGNNSVNITVLGCGNYSAKLSDYYSPKNAGMITIILRNNDLKEPVLPIQLYMSVTNNLKTYIQTKSPNTSKIFQLYAGETLTLTGQDLECIFNTYYLNYKKSNFQDGQNILKIYARDTRTGKIVSNTAQILLKSVMIAPPKLTSPDDNFTIETNNQFVNFTWRGDNGGANIATRCNYRYKFELWKQNINDKNVEAQRFADFTADNLFDEKYQFLLANFPFEIGQKYCWRITAYDPFEKATFSQNGKSEVRSFIYKHIPVPVTGLKHTINERNRQATVTWNAAEGHTKYYVEYYNPQTTKTIAMEKDEPKFTLASAPEKEYTILFRVKAQCWGDDSRCSNWSDWDTIKYAAPQIVEPKYPCGYQFPKVEITNFELKTDFKEGDIVSEANGSSDYEIINCKSDVNGVLQGQFYLIMNAWGGAKIACEFWDTKINTDNQIITTRYRSIDTPVGMVEPEELANYVKSLWLDGNSLATSSKIRDTIVIDQKFDYLYRRESGEFVAVVVNDDGSTTETKFDLHKNPSQTLITDGKGDSLVYSQNGQVMGIKEYRATGGNAALLKDYHRKSDSLAQWKINFLPYSEQEYAFDYIGSGNHGIFSGSEYYPYLSGNYDLRFKSVECYKTDKVIVDFGSYQEADSVVFKDKYGVTLKLSKGNVLNFTGVAKPDTNYIYAYRGDEKIGKLSVNTYKKKSYKVVLVSVNKATLPDISSLQDSLNKFYKQSVVNFEVDTVNFYLPELLSFSHGGSPWNSVYNDDQKKVLSAYDKAKTMQDGVYYLFFIDNVTDKKDGDGTMVSGYMPRGYNCGFIYDGGSEHTVAHELGHGIAGLEHVFENSKSSGKTKNLMDYADGTQLWHFQWDQIQDPSRVWMKWNKDESEGENISTSTMVCINDEKALEIINKYHDFYLPDNSVIHIDNANYQASGFIIQDEIKRDSPLTEGALSGLRYLGGDYILYYNSQTLKSQCFRYEIAKNQYSTLINTNELLHSDENNAVRVFVDQKTNRLVIKNKNEIVENVLLNGKYTCQQPPVVTLPKYYFDIEDNVGIGVDISNDEEIINSFVYNIINDKRLIDNNISSKLQSKLSNFQDNYRLIVKFLEVNKMTSNQESWQQLAKKVYEKLGKEYEDNILVSIPYYFAEEKYFFMPGLCYSKNVIFNDKFSELFKNTSRKVMFDENDVNEPIVQFLIKVYEGIVQLKTTDKVTVNDSEADKEFDKYSDIIKRQLIVLNNVPNLKKPKLTIWIDSAFYKSDINILKQYIKAAFANCVDFHLGFDLEFENGLPNYMEDNIVVGITKSKNLWNDISFIPSSIAGQRGNGNRGVTPLKTNLPIWVDYDISDYSFITFALFHEICHRISAIGAISLIKFPFFKFYYSTDHHDSDGNSMMASGEGENTIYKRMNGKNYTIDEMVANKQNWKYNSKRNFVILYQLLLNLKKYNEIE